MKKLALVILFLLAMIILALTVLIKTANASTSADDPGNPWGWYTVVARSADQTTFTLEYINKPGEYCQVKIKTECTDPGLQPPNIGDKCERIGNQKYDCEGNTQILRWTETLIQKCWAFLSKLAKCPPCPVCPSGALDCVSCAGSGQ